MTSKMTAEQKLRIVQDEINNIPGAKNIMSDKVMICCPYHSDSNPSMSVQMDVHERNAPVGWGYCFGCKKSVPWNTLATTLNLKKFGKNENLSSDDFGDPSAHKDSFLGTALGIDDDDEDADYKRFPDMADLEFFDDFPFDEWRTVDVDLLTKVGAKFVKHNDYDRHWIWIPVRVNKVLRGYVRATLDKAPPGKSSYLNAKGGWSRKWGLIYFDYAIKLMKKKGLHTMVMCEGPRDSLRFLARGIPAVSVLGAMNWGADKRGLLEQAGVEKVILAFDGDKAGWSAAKLIYTDCRKFFNTKYLALWKKSPAWNPETRKFPSDKKIKRMKKKGLLKGEMDPFNMPEKYVDLVKDNLE